MNHILILIDGEEYVATAAETMHEAGKEIRLWKERARKFEPKSEITVILNGRVHVTPKHVLDLHAVAINMKTERIEDMVTEQGDI